MSGRAGTTPLAVSDEDLLCRAQHGDVDAFEALYDRHNATAYGLARVISPTAEEAQDALQESFLSVWHDRARFDPMRGSAKAWILMMVRHRSIDMLRRSRRGDRRRAPAEQLELLPGPSSPPDSVVSRDEADRLRASLRQLPALQREVIYLAYFGGLTHAEISRSLDVPLGTVKSRMRLGLGKVRAQIDFEQASAPVRAQVDFEQASAPVHCE